MITKDELNAVSLSATKKDFYQIWEELLDVAGKISSRWDPAHTNESDPGLVLLKVLTAVADKINYNIDVNTLEAFMPSAAQLESMRNLCEMMGYNMKYYNSATTDIVMSYTGEWPSEDITAITLPMFTTITNSEKDITYTTVEAKNFSESLKLQTISCIEGQPVQCETINNNVVTIDLLDDNYRYYLPESTVAENGIFIYNVADGVVSSDRWEKVDFIYAERLNKKVYKFGYDSREAKPYVQFPEDIAQIIEDGLLIHYIRTSGNAGNIAAWTLSTFEKPSDDENWNSFNVEDFTIYNSNAAQNGTNEESIDDAYTNYKKTIGTFDTLVTCRDYMNKIYSLMDDKNIPLVSNVIVTDIRNDINKAITICSFNDYGITYKDKPVYENNEAQIEHFDLILYPFKTVSGSNTYSEYTNSFKLYPDNSLSITTELENNKTISHNIRLPEETDIVAIKNYLKIDAKITTTEKVNSAEELLIIDDIKKELYKNFNLRNLDFGEEIPYDSILSVIENAHTKIKSVSMAEPTLYTKFLLADGQEYDLASVEKDENNTFRFRGREIYNKLALRNILAGRLELFNYNTDFKFGLNESKCDSYNSVYPSNSSTRIIKVEPAFTPNVESQNLPLILTKNQRVQFRAPNFTTDITYPAYVNYYLKLNTSNATEATAASFISLASYMNTNQLWSSFLVTTNNYAGVVTAENNVISSETMFSTHFTKLSDTALQTQTYKTLKDTYGALYIKTLRRYLFWIEDEAVSGYSDYSNSNGLTNIQTDFEDSTYGKIEGVYVPVIDDYSFGTWKTFLQKTNSIADLYQSKGTNSTRPVGYLVDSARIKYQLCTTPLSAQNVWTGYKIPLELGTDANINYIKKGTEYQLKTNEYLLINYTSSATTTADDGTTTSTEGEEKNIVYGAGEIIKPNFDLYNSESLSATYSKTTNVSTSNFSASNINTTHYGTVGILDSLSGMYTLGSNEQIEHRKQAQVILNKPYYIYWALQGDTSRKFKTSGEYQSYTLEDNEYLFITSAENGTAKLDMTYYGSGTVLTIPNTTNLISSNVTAISLESILTEGISAIPWKYYDFTSNNLTVSEYQYITLSEGDAINNDLQFSTSETASTPTTLSSTWVPIDNATYVSNNQTATLPVIDLNSSCLWEISSSLILNCGPTKAIDLVTNESISLTYNNEQSKNVQIIRGNTTNPVSVQTSYGFNTTSSSISINIAEGDAELKVKVSETKPFTVNLNENSDGEDYSSQIHNFGDNITSIDFEQVAQTTESSETTSKKYLTFSLNIPSDCYGLMMFYVVGSLTNAKDNPYIKVSTDNVPQIFNYNGWWEDRVENNDYYLKPGINIVKFPNSVKEFKLCSNLNSPHKVVFSDLDVVYSTNDINFDLIQYAETSASAPRWSTVTNINDVPLNTEVIVYDKTTDSASYFETGLSESLRRKVASSSNYEFTYKNTLQEDTQNNLRTSLLENLNELDPNHEFYYNNVINNSVALNINTSLLDTEDAQTLASPLVWYDSNNVNSHFVISEIDADYLENKNGIILTRASKSL